MTFLGLIPGPEDMYILAQFNLNILAGEDIVARVKCLARFGTSLQRQKGSPANCGTAPHSLGDGDN